MALTHLSFPSDPVNEAAWSRLLDRIPSKVPVDLDLITINLPFSELAELEEFIEDSLLHVTDIGPNKNLVRVVLYGEKRDLVLLKLKWGGEIGLHTP